MKRTVFIVVLLVLSISIPMLAESNDLLSAELENPVLQNQELKLPWYKTVKYEIGYTGGICLNSTPLGQWHDMIHNNFTWFNTFDISIILHEKHLGIGFEYGWWPHLTNRWGLYTYYQTSDSSGALRTGGNWAIYYNGILLKYYKTKSFYYGFSVNHYIANTEESCHSTVNGNISDTTACVQRKCIGCDIFCSLERHILLKRFEIIPFLKLQIGHAKEYHNNSPWEWGSKKLTIGTSGIFLGMNMRFGGER